MSNRKVRVNVTLVGKARPKFKSLKDLTNKEIFYWMESQVLDQFGSERPLFICDEEMVLIEGRKYPEFYSAGWFVSDDPVSGTEGIGSELVVVAHGDSMKSAQEAVMAAIGNTSWDNLAKNI